MDTAIDTAELIDPRILQLSYSSLLTLHSCPRKFQLYRLKSAQGLPPEDDYSPVTFAYGHIVGQGIQDVLMGMDEDEIILRMFLMWDIDLLEDDPKRQKSFWLGVTAIQRFISLRANGFLDDYELVEYNGKPAVELGFRIVFPDGFVFRGFVDAVLRHKPTGKIVVLECKTSSFSNLNPAIYKNSAQGIGYSIVLDAIFPELSSYEVLYLVYKTKDREYEQLCFEKSYLQRALWIRELLLDIETIKLYESSGVYPMRGESCYSYFRDCEYLSLCTLRTTSLTTPIDMVAHEAKNREEDTRISITLTLMDLINSQMEKA